MSIRINEFILVNNIKYHRSNNNDDYESETLECTITGMRNKGCAGCILSGQDCYYTEYSIALYED